MENGSSKDNFRCTVQSKIKCAFATEVKHVKSTKRFGQTFLVTATESFIKDAVESDISSAFPSEKIDGTCCLISPYQGKMCLWARYDRKPNKKSDKKFKEMRHQHANWIKNGEQGTEPHFKWKYPDDMKVVPESWKPGDRVDRDSITGTIVPDINGHIPGWIPVTVDPRQYRWHSSTVDQKQDLLLILKQPQSLDIKTGNCILELHVDHMSNYNGRTLELIGTNINANPYCLGSKQHPFHVLVDHGSISIQGELPKLDFYALKDWFQNKSSDFQYGDIEGIVWHCKNGNMFKIHRHHLGLGWPIKRQLDGDQTSTTFPFLSNREITVNCDLVQSQKDDDLDGNTMFPSIKHLHLKTYKSFKEMSVVI